MTAIIVIGAVAVGTYLLRASLVAFAGPDFLPERLEQALPQVGPAVMAAIIMPAVLAPGEAIELLGLRPLAAGVAIIVAWRWRSLPLVLAAGLGVAALGLLI